MSLRETTSRTIVFPEKRPWPTLLGTLLMTLCPAGLIGYLVYEFARIAIVWKEGPVGVWLALEILLFLLSLVFLLIVVAVMLVGVVFFGGMIVPLWKDCLRPPGVVELLPEGICGRTNIGDIVIPWSCVESVRLELGGKQTAIGIETTQWPPDPLWKDCSSSVRRMLWQRHNRRQTPLILYIHHAAAPPEVILHTIQKELIRARERDSVSHAPEEGGTPSC